MAAPSAPRPAEQPHARSEHTGPRHARHRGSRVHDRPARTGRRRLSWYTEILVIVGVVLVGSLLLKTFVVQAFWIPSGSMEPTLRVNDRVLVDKLSYRFGSIHRGDVVVFNGLDSFTPEVAPAHHDGLSGLLHSVGAAVGVTGDEHDFVKRVIGLPGDRVTCCDVQGRITVNGVPLDENYLYPGNAPSLEPFDIRVPPRRLWVMGDHRSVSADSRSHLGDPGGGTVPTSKVIGKAVLVVWPTSHWAELGTPRTFAQRGLALAALLVWPVRRGTIRRGTARGSRRQ